SSCSVSRSFVESARPSEAADGADELLDVRVTERRAEARHARPSDGRPAVLDDVEQVLIGAAADGPTVTQIARADQEERRSPGALPIDAMTGRAEPEVESLDRGRAGRRTGRVEEPGQPTGEDADRREHDQERRERPTHGGEDSTGPQRASDSTYKWRPESIKKLILYVMRSVGARTAKEADNA